MDDPERKKLRKHEIEPLSLIVNRLITSIRKTAETQKNGSEEILSGWTEIVGPEVASHAKPLKMAKGALFIEVDSSAWLHQLNTFAKPVLLNTLKQRWPWIREIKFTAVQG